MPAIGKRQELVDENIHVVFDPEYLAGFTDPVRCALYND
jgi:hypothetical protein